MANGKRQERPNYKKIEDLVIDHARILNVNFKGADKWGYNPKHERGFWLALDPERFDLDAIRDDGWNLKTKEPREGYEDNGPLYYIPIKVRWDNFPPVIYLLTRAGGTDENPRYRRTKMDEEASFEIDDARIERVDLEIRPSHYDVNGNQGIAAYLKKMYIIIEEDKLDKMYSFVDDYDDDEIPFD